VGVGRGLFKALFKIFAWREVLRKKLEKFR
jgi:hypothetical protein